MTEHETACKVLDLQIKLNELNKQQKSLKEMLRDFADGEKKEIIVENVGKIYISSPSAGKEITTLMFNEEKLNELPDLKIKLIQKGIMKEETKKTFGSIARVTVKLNV